MKTDFYIHTSILLESSFFNKTTVLSKYFLQNIKYSTVSWLIRNTLTKQGSNILTCSPSKANCDTSGINLSMVLTSFSRINVSMSIKAKKNYWSTTIN